MKPNAQRGRYAEIPRTAAQGPKQVGVSAGICNDVLPILQHNLRLEQIIGGETITSEQRPVAARPTVPRIPVTGVSPCAAAAATTSLTVAPPATIATLVAGSTAT